MVDERVGRDAVGEPDVAAHQAVVTDYGVASKHGCVRVDHHPISDGRGALGAGSGLGDTQRAERHPLVELDLVADDGGLPDDPTGTVIDSKPTAGRRPRMDVNAGSG